MWVGAVVVATATTTSNIAPYRGIDSNHSCITNPSLVAVINKIKEE